MKRPFAKFEAKHRASRPAPKPDSDRPQRPEGKTYKPRPTDGADNARPDRPQRPEQPEKRFDGKPRPPRTADNHRPPSRNDRPGGTPFKREKPQFMPKIEEAAPEAESNRLNKFLADCGICSRRAAQVPIEKGEVAINGTVIKEIGYRVMREDVVTYKDKVIKPNTRKIYILLNKPKDTINCNGYCG
jgi:23S rRNA pseudouridine2605 synthase